MHKLILLTLVAIVSTFNSLCATIIKTNEIEAIKQEVTSDSLVLFNIAEVLLDTKISLGTQAWRKYLRARVDAKTHDQLTYFVFLKVPPKPVEPITPALISDIQDQGIPVFAFTSRGRHEWYSSQIIDIDLVTELVLSEAGIDFSQTQLPEQLSQLDQVFGEYYHAGIIYATNSLEKGEILERFMQTTGYTPKKVVFIDDKADSLHSVESMLEKHQIPFVGYAYGRTAQDHVNFDPIIATIQLDWLITQNEILSDADAQKIKEKHYPNTDPQELFKEVIKKWSAYIEEHTSIFL